MKKAKESGSGLQAVSAPSPMRSAERHYEDACRYLSGQAHSDIIVAAFMITAALDYLAVCTTMAASRASREDREGQV